MIDRYDSCESDLHGRLAVLTATGLIEEVDVGGERGYRLSDDAETALETIGGGVDDTVSERHETTAGASDR